MTNVQNTLCFFVWPLGQCVQRALGQRTDCGLAQSFSKGSAQPPVIHPHLLGFAWSPRQAGLGQCGWLYWPGGGKLWLLLHVFVLALLPAARTMARVLVPAQAIFCTGARLLPLTQT